VRGGVDGHQTAAHEQEHADDEAPVDVGPGVGRVPAEQPEGLAPERAGDGRHQSCTPLWLICTHDVSARGGMTAAWVELGSSMSDCCGSASGVFVWPETASKRHFTTGAAPSAPKPPRSITAPMV